MNTKAISVHRQGETVGPFTLAEVNRKLQQGELSPSDLAWPEGEPNWIPLASVPGVSCSSPPPLPKTPPPMPATVAARGDATGGIIPYKNPKALTAYYLGVFSLIPCIGFFLGIASIILGCLGLKARKQNPKIHGVAHAWVGIVLGSLVVLGHLSLVVWVMWAAHNR